MTTKKTNRKKNQKLPFRLIVSPSNYNEVSDPIPTKHGYKNRKSFWMLSFLHQLNRQPPFFPVSSSNDCSFFINRFSVKNTSTSKEQLHFIANPHYKACTYKWFELLDVKKKARFFFHSAKITQEPKAEFTLLFRRKSQTSNFIWKTLQDLKGLW